MRRSNGFKKAKKHKGGVTTHVGKLAGISYQPRLSGKTKRGRR